MSYGETRIRHDGEWSNLEWLALCMRITVKFDF